MTTYAGLPERMRIFELAKRLDVPAADLLKRISRLDIEAQSVLKSVSRSEIRLILEDYRGGDINGSMAPDPNLIDELLRSLGPPPVSRINDAPEQPVEGRSQYRPDDDARRVDFEVQIDLAQVDEAKDEETKDEETLVEETQLEVVDQPANDLGEEQPPAGRPMSTSAGLPERMRILDLAKRLDVPAAVLLKRISRLDIKAPTVLRTVTRSDIRLILEDYRGANIVGSTAPDPDLIDELLRSLGPSPVSRINDAPVTGSGEFVTYFRRDVDYDAEGEALRDDRQVHPDLEDEPTLVSPLVELDDGSRDDVVEVDPHDSDEEEPRDVKPQVVVEEVLEADTPLVHRDDEPEDLTRQVDLEHDDSPERLASDEAQHDHSGDATDDLSGEVLDHPQDDVLLAALFEAGVVEDDDTSQDEEDVELIATEKNRDRGFFKRWRGVDARTRIIAVGIGIVLGTMLLSTVYAVLRPTYAAESEIVITISGLGSEEIQRELQSFAVVASSQTVLAPVADEFGISVLDVREAFAPAIVGDSTVLRFTTTAGSPEEALALNEAITASYLGVANDPLDQSELAFVTDRMDQAIAEIAAVDSELSELEAVEAANASTRLQIETERNVAQAQLADLEGRLVDLRASGAAPPGSVNFIEGQINTTQTRLDELVADTQALESEDAGVRSAANRLRDERSVLRDELGDLQSLRVQIELDQIAGTRVAVLAPGHAADDAVGLTPMRAIILGLLVGGALAFAWVIAATQLRKKK